MKSVRTNRIAVLALLSGTLAVPSLATARPARTGTGKGKGTKKTGCKNRRYGCAARPPAYYDRFVRTVRYPAKGQDRACLARLRKAGIRFRMLDRVKGVKTPVLVLSRRLGGVLYRKSWNNNRRFILDCRMVEVLAARGRAIRRAGIA